jgi:Domain of unknown function (DUF4388)
VKFLVLAPDEESSPIRQAARDAGCAVVCTDAVDSLAGWLATTRPDAVVVSTKVLSSGPKLVAERIRRFATEVPIIFLCDATESAEAEQIGNLALIRPAVPAEVVRVAVAIIEAQTSASGEFNATPGNATRPASDPGLALALLSEPPSLQPLGQNVRGRVSSRPARNDSQDVPWTDDWMPALTETIDRTLDAEMALALEAVLGPESRDGRPERPSEKTPGPFGTESTIEISREDVDSIIARSRIHSGAPVEFIPSHNTRRAVGTWRRSFDGSELPQNGELVNVGIADLLGAALENTATGRLRLKRADVEKSIFFEAGRPVLAVSSAATDRMVQMLVRERTISVEQADRAMALAADTRRRMGVVLVDLGFLKSGELLPAVRRHYEEIILSLFEWEEGTYRFESGETADPRRVRLLQHPAAIVVEGIGRGYSDARLSRAYGSPLQMLRLRQHAGVADIMLEVTSGDPSISRLPVLFDGVRTVIDIVRASGQSESVVLQVALALRAFGVLQGTVAATGDETPTPEIMARDSEIDRERIRQRLRFVAEGSYFDVLGLEPTASVAEIRAAHDRIRRETSDLTIGPVLAAELAGELRMLRVALDEASWILGDDTTRELYRAQALPVDSGDADAGAPGQRI